MGEPVVLEAISADGTRLGCEVFGDGPPLLVVHGSAADRTRWTVVRPRLEARWRVHLMDRRGRGLSAAEAPGSYALEREADDVRAVLAAIGAPTRVLAHSYGATCALAAAAADGSGIARMVAYEPGFGTSDEGIFPAQAVREVEAALARGDREGALVSFYRGVLHLDAAAIAAMQGTPLWEARVAVAHTLAREAHEANAYRPAGLRSIGPSVCFLLGTETTPGLRAAALAAHAAAPGSELRDLPGQAHAAMDGDPDLFMRRVEEWLA